MVYSIICHCLRLGSVEKADMALHVGPMMLMWMLTMWVQHVWRGCCRGGPHNATWQSDVWDYSKTRGNLTDGTSAVLTIGTQSVLTSGADKLPTSGTHSVPTSGTHSVPRSGTHSVLTCGADKLPTSGTQSVLASGANRLATWWWWRWPILRQALHWTENCVF